MRNIISNQPDFKEQKCRVAEIVEERGHICIFLPKFHCELNWIEMYWGYVKRLVRQQCTYSFRDLEKTVPKVLDEVASQSILLHRFQRKVLRYMDAYKKGASGRLATFAVSKYRGHRCLPES